MIQFKLHLYFIMRWIFTTNFMNFVWIERQMLVLNLCISTTSKTDCQGSFNSVKRLHPYYLDAAFCHKFSHTNSTNRRINMLSECHYSCAMVLSNSRLPRLLARDEHFIIMYIIIYLVENATFSHCSANASMLTHAPWWWWWWRCTEQNSWPEN